MLLKILSYNIQLCPTFVITQDNNKRAILISEYIGRNFSSLDIITFCEAFDAHSRNILLNGLIRYGFLYSSEVLDTDNFFYNGGVIIVSKHPIINTNFHIFKNSSGSDSLSNKGIVYSRILVELEYVNIFTTHLQAWEMSSEVRNKQIVELTDFIKYYNFDIKDIVIVTGDFNCDFKNIKKHSRNMFEYPNIISKQKYTLDSSTNSLVGIDGSDLKYDNTLRIGNKYIDDNENIVHSMSVKSEVLDYIFLLKNCRKPEKSCLSVVNVKTDNVYYFNIWKISWLSSWYSDKYFYTKDLSDHYPVLGEFEFS